MRVAYDAEADAAYLYLKAIAPAEVAKTVEGEGDAAGINLDFDAEGRLIGIEVLEAGGRLPGELLRRAEKQF